MPQTIARVQLEAEYLFENHRLEHIKARLLREPRHLHTDIYGSQGELIK